MTTLKQNSTIEASLRRMRQMGLNVSIVGEGQNKALIFITLESVMKMIERGVKYPNKKVNYENPFIIVEVWRE